MQKKKILIFTENLYGGGVERIQQIICQSFDYQCYDLTIYSLRHEKIDSKFYPLNITYKYVFDSIESNMPLYEKFISKLKNKIKLLFYYHTSASVFYQLFLREKADVAIAFIEGYATRIVSGFPASKTKKIAWVHINLEDHAWSKVAYRNTKEESIAYKSMDSVICVSKGVQKATMHLFPKLKNIGVIYNPIDRDYILNLSQQSLPEIQINRNSTKKIQLLSVGSLVPRKGHDRLLRIVKRLLDEGFDFNLWILGEGSERKNLEKLIHDDNIEEHVKLLGYFDNPYPFIKASDLYVCPSYAEGYNTVITESLILGTPVVSTECSGVKEQLGDNNEFGLCTPNDEQSLYDGIKTMLSGTNLDYYTKQAKIRGEIYTLEKGMNPIYKLLQ